MSENTPLDTVSVATPLDGLTQWVQEDSRVRRENRAMEVSLATKRDAEEIASEIEDGNEQSVAEAKASTGDAVGEVFTAATQVQADPERTAQALQEASQKQAEFTSGNGFFLEGALVKSDPRYSPALARLLTNQQIAAEVLEEKFSETQEKGFGGKAVDFIDRYIFRHIPIGLYEDITRESESVGLELAEAASSMSPDEYRRYIQEYADGIASEGFFKDDNYFAFTEALDEARNAGYDPQANFNQVLGIVEAVPLVGTSLRAGKMLTRVGSLKGPEAAADAYETLSDTVKGIHPEVQAETLPKHLDSASGGIKPTLSRVAKVAEENKLLQDIQHLYESGTFGRAATPEQVRLASENIRKNVEGITSRPIAGEDIVDPTGLGDYTSVFRLGRMKKGDPYKVETNANKYALQLQDKGLSASTVPVDANDLSKGYYVEVAQRLDLTKVADPVSLKSHQNAFDASIGRALGSARYMDDEYLTTLANMGESGMGAIREAVEPYLKPLSNLDLDSKAAIGKVFRDLRDGPDAYIRNGYSELEFRAKFKDAHPKGKAPTQKDIDAFNAARTVNDAAYILQANRIALRYVEKGYKSLQLDSKTSIPGRVVTDTGKFDNIYNASTGRIIVKSDLPEGTVIWKTDRELEGGVDLVAQPRNVTEVKYEEVLPYNAGGRRVNPDARYFVTAGDRAILTSFTEAQARKASTQLEAIFAAVRSSGTKIDQLTDELDEVIKKNNDWNPSIENTADFAALVAQKGWRTDQTVSLKPRDGIVEASDSELFAGMTMDDYVKATGRRSDDVLMEYGGKETFNYNPIKAMVDQMSSVASEYSFRAYNQQSKVGWLKAAGFGKQLEDGFSIPGLWKQADEMELKGNKGRRLRQLKAVIDRRDQVQSPVSKALGDFGEITAEWAFSASKGKVKVNLDQMDVPGALLNLGFRSAFGFFNVSQFLLQSSHAFTISAISPKHGSRAAAMVLPLRLAMASWDKAGVKRAGKYFGVSEADMEELVTYINTSGRKMIENDAIEKGTGPGFGVSTWEGRDMKPSVVRKGLFQASKVVDVVDRAGLAAFNEGERLSRWTGIITAFLEYKAKYGGASALSDSGRMWITRREQDLSFNMTTTSRGAWQAGLMRVPTQWLSYSMRAMENVVVGRGFTPGERIRMGLSLAALGGTAGLFIPGVADQIGERTGLESTDPAYTGMMYGVYDGILTWMLQATSDEDIRTAFGTRLAPLTAFSDLYRKVVDESSVAALGGPSGEIVGGAFVALAKSLGDIGGGHTESAWSDIETVLRTPSGIDNVVKAIGMANTGVYRSKTGTELPMEFSNLEAAMQAAGVTNFKVADFYRERTSAFRDDRSYNKFRKELENDFRRAVNLWEEDQTRAKTFMKEIEARIEASGFSPLQQDRLRRSLLTTNNDMLKDLILRKLQEDKNYAAERIESLGSN